MSFLADLVAAPDWLQNLASQWLLEWTLPWRTTWKSTARFTRSTMSSVEQVSDC